MSTVRRPLRQHLKPFLACKRHFSGRVRKFGRVCLPYRKGVPTICLRNVLLYLPDGEMAHIGHVWVHAGKTIAAFDPRVGDWISFDARVYEYHKADGFDYGICRLSNLDLLSAGRGPSFEDHLSMLMLSGEHTTYEVGVPCTA